MVLRGFLVLILLFHFAAPLRAAEQINSFEAIIDVATSGDISVTETIVVTAEGDQIRRGIFRDLPRYYSIDGIKYPYDYSVQSVKRDGKGEPYVITSDRNQTRVRIGDADVFLRRGTYAYEIKYRVKNQIRYFKQYDEIYWNVTGNYWVFPIVTARATVVLPPGTDITGAEAFTGRFRSGGKNYNYYQNGDTHVFRTTKPLGQREGLTVAVGITKGLIDPPSAADKTALWWQRYGAMGILISSLFALFGFYYSSFNRVGRDPAKGPVFPRYQPPDGYSPAAVHHIFYRHVSGHKALIATLLNLATNGRISIEPKGNLTVLSKNEDAEGATGIAAEDYRFEKELFSNGMTQTLGKSYDAEFTSAYTRFKSSISISYGRPFFRGNVFYIVVAVALTGLAIVVAITQAVVWTSLHTLVIIALAALNGWFMYLMPAPTRKGQEIRTEIEGFKLYLETAEKLHLNAVDVGGDALPPMTTERYEKFLPFAIALGVEKPWTRHFERLIPEEAKSYNPHWTTMRAGNYRSLHGLNSALVANISSGVASSLPQSSSSSGSGGGGFSGGGGGGGGGGGW